MRNSFVKGKYRLYYIPVLDAWDISPLDHYSLQVQLRGHVRYWSDRPNKS